MPRLMNFRRRCPRKQIRCSHNSFSWQGNAKGRLRAQDRELDREPLVPSDPEDDLIEDILYFRDGPGSYYAAKKKIRKPYILECRDTESRWADWQEWHVRGRYRTERARDDALRQFRSNRLGWRMLGLARRTPEEYRTREVAYA